MNELQISGKFLMWACGVVFALGLISHIGFMTYTAAEVAAEAQKKDQTSYGKFSRRLWPVGKVTGKRRNKIMHKF